MWGPDLQFTYVPLLYWSLDSFFTVSFLSCLNLQFLFDHTAQCYLCLSLEGGIAGIPAIRCFTHSPLSSSLTRCLGCWWFLPDVSQEGSTNLNRCSLSSGVGGLLQGSGLQSPALLPSCPATWPLAAHSWLTCTSGSDAMANTTQE